MFTDPLEDNEPYHSRHFRNTRPTSLGIASYKYTLKRRFFGRSPKLLCTKHLIKRRGGVPFLKFSTFPERPWPLVQLLRENPVFPLMETLDTLFNS